MARTSAKAKTPAVTGQGKAPTKTSPIAKSKPLDDDLDEAYEDDTDILADESVMAFTGNSTVRRRLESFLEEKRLRETLKDDFYEEW